MSKKTKTAPKVSEKDASNSVVEEVSNESDIIDEKTNGDCEVAAEISQEEPCSISEEPNKVTEGKGQVELKPPRVLEVFA